MAHSSAPRGSTKTVVSFLIYYHLCKTVPVLFLFRWGVQGNLSAVIRSDNNFHDFRGKWGSRYLESSCARLMYFHFFWASDLQLWLLLQVYQASCIYFSVSGLLILLACFVIKANKSRSQVHAVLQYSRVMTIQAWKMYFWISFSLEDTPISLHNYFPHI